MAAIRRLTPYVFLVCLLAVAGVLFLQKDLLIDKFYLRGYQPSSQIAQLAADTSMTAYGERLFYVNDPQVDNKEELSVHCSGLPQEEAVLGCFTGNRNGIYIYKVDEPLLNGVEQVTVAHEMLHQAYARLSDKNRKHIDGLLEDYYNQHLTDQSVISKMESYKKTEPKDLVNEMHSVFGTEIADLPKELETYYSQYFKDRLKIVAYRNQYQAEFDKRMAQIDAYDAELTSLKPQIEEARADLDRQIEALKQERDEMDQLLASNDIRGYNARVPGYNAGVLTYKRAVANVNALIDRYNQLVNERNAISVERTQLQDALDSRLDSAKKQ